MCERWQARAIGFVGRGLDRRVDSPFGRKAASCLMCHDCVDVCPMTIIPCDGPMKPGEEYLCGKCKSQLSMNERFPEMCVQCELGEAFSCSRVAG
jgi:hypothetical protein